MGSINIQFQKGDLESFLQSKSSEILPKAIEMIDDITNSFKDTMLSYTPIGETHGLYDQTISEETGTLDREITSNAPQFEWVVGGTKPHSIGAPVFIWTIGEFRYIGLSPKGRGIIHPGYTGNDYPSLAFMDTINTAENRAEDFLNWITE